jgi:hypothetical protein
MGAYDEQALHATLPFGRVSFDKVLLILRHFTAGASGVHLWTPLLLQPGDLEANSFFDHWTGVDALDDAAKQHEPYRSTRDT